MGLDDLEVATCRWVGWFNEQRLHGVYFGADLACAELVTEGCKVTGCGLLFGPGPRRGGCALCT